MTSINEKVKKIVESHFKWLGHVRRILETSVRRVDEMEDSPIARDEVRARQNHRPYD